MLRFVLLLTGIGLSACSSCTSSADCPPLLHCHQSACRRAFCSSSGDCARGEVCEFGMVDGVRRTACFPSKRETTTLKKHLCPGGDPLTSLDGLLATCSASQPCAGKGLCNPKMGVCCTKLRTCPMPYKTMLDAGDKKPIACQYKGGAVSVCPAGGHCELQTGFCCMRSGDKSPQPPQPALGLPGSVCRVKDGCRNGAECVCKGGSCRCECPSSLGYSLSSDGQRCERMRRRLKEKCSSDAECSAAYSECSSGGCRCKPGFQRDGKGGCQPTAYMCPTGKAPLSGLKPEQCWVKMDTPRLWDQQGEESEGGEVPEGAALSPVESSESLHAQAAALLNISLADWEGPSDCSPGHYCVPVHEDATRQGFLQGFCCPSPADVRPACPVGVAHASSEPPSYGCATCPSDHYCHADPTAHAEICCPRPCISIDDVFVDGQCLSLAYHGDSCSLDAQCRSQLASPSFPSAPLKCLDRQCVCPAGFHWTDGLCQRPFCSVGIRSEPSLDSRGSVVRCARNADCGTGFLCDPAGRVCCRGVNRCPSGFSETGTDCSDGKCVAPGEALLGRTLLCHHLRKSSTCCIKEV